MFFLLILPAQHSNDIDREGSNVAGPPNSVRVHDKAAQRGVLLVQAQGRENHLHHGVMGEVGDHLPTTTSDVSLKVLV